MAYYVGGLNVGHIYICAVEKDQQSARSLWELSAQKLECAV